MKVEDILFRFYKQGEMPVSPNDIAYIQWSEDTVSNFYNYSYAYRQTAEALYEQFVSHNGDYAMKDPMGITLSFMYRHYLELITKFLYLKFTPYVQGRPLSDDELACFIQDTQHNLGAIWIRLKPVLDELSSKLENTFDIRAFGHYISVFHRYDEFSMKMRYPVDKKGKPIETKSQRLDIKILHDYMADCMNEVDKLVNQWDDQIFWDDDEELGNLFIGQYADAKVDVEQFLLYEEKYAEGYKKKHKGNGLKFMSPRDIALERLPEEITVIKFLKTLPDNHLLVIHNLYYIGSTCLRNIKVWKKESDRRLQFIRSAGYICRNEVNKFNRPVNRRELIDTIISRIPEVVYNAVNGCVEICTW
jgi:hypothetical protein